VLVAEPESTAAALVLHAGLAALNRADRNAVRATNPLDPVAVRLDIVELGTALRAVADLEVVVAVDSVVVTKRRAAIDALAAGLGAAGAAQEALTERTVGINPNHESDPH
jgi:hypothetical protein